MVYMNTHTVITARGAYGKGRACNAGDFQEALERFNAKYCAHSYADKDFCELCIAWQNGYDNQAQYWVHDHAKICALGFADRDNHRDCEYDK